MAQRRSVAWFLPIALLVAVGAGAWWWQSIDVPPPQPHVGGSPTETPSVQSADADAVPTVDTPVRESVPPAAAALDDTPLPDGPIGTVHAELVRRAEAGDGRAAIALAHTFALCLDYTPDQRETLESSLVELMAHGSDTPGDDGKAATGGRFVDLAVGVLDQRDRLCPGIDTLGVNDRTAERDRWLALALDLGHPAALVQAANDMLKKPYPRRSDIINHAEEVRALRPQAMAMLQRAAAQGEPLALLRLATAHHSGDLAERDPVAAYAYMLAYRNGPPTAVVQPVMAEGIERQLLAGLTPEQIQAAQARAVQIRARCCTGG